MFVPFEEKKTGKNVDDSQGCGFCQHSQNSERDSDPTGSSNLRAAETACRVIDGGGSSPLLVKPRRRLMEDQQPIHVAGMPPRPDRLKGRN